MRNDSLLKIRVVNHLPILVPNELPAPVEPAFRTSIMERVSHLNVGWYGWDNPEFLSLCRLTGLDPEQVRPSYHPDLEAIGLALQEWQRNQPTAGGEPGDQTLHIQSSVECFVLKFGHWIRCDQYCEPVNLQELRQTFDNIDREGWFTDFKLPYGTEIHALLRTPPAVLVQRDLTEKSLQRYVVVSFLPSSFGGGYKATIHVGGSGRGIDPQGWHKDLYSNLGGVAEDTGDDSLHYRLVMTKLVEQGVQLLSSRQTEIYMREEGRYWLWKNGHLDAASLAERMTWTLRPPITPIGSTARIAYRAWYRANYPAAPYDDRLAV